MPKKRVKLTQKYIDGLGLNIGIDEIPEDSAYIKRISTEQKDLKSEDDGYSMGAISTIDIDSDGDVVLPKGINLGRYEKNPIVLFNHSVNSPIGFAEELKVEDDKIIAKTRYGSTEEAQKIYQLVLDKVLRTHSIGFVATEWFQKGEEEYTHHLAQLIKSFPDKFNKDSNIARIITKSILCEYSIVTIPANEDAVIHEMKMINEVEEVIEEEVEEVEEIIEQKDIEVIEENTEEVEEVVEEKSVVITQNDEKKQKIKFLRKKTSIKKVSTLKERANKYIYENLWGV